MLWNRYRGRNICTIISGEKPKLLGLVVVAPNSTTGNREHIILNRAECMNSSRMSEWLECIRIEKAAGKVRSMQRVALEII